jgi:hypothetical protein
VPAAISKQSCYGAAVRRSPPYNLHQRRAFSQQMLYAPAQQRPLKPLNPHILPHGLQRHIPEQSPLGMLTAAAAGLLPCLM